MEIKMCRMAMEIKWGMTCKWCNVKYCLAIFWSTTLGHWQVQWQWKLYFVPWPYLFYWIWPLTGGKKCIYLDIFCSTHLAHEGNGNYFLDLIPILFYWTCPLSYWWVAMEIICLYLGPIRFYWTRSVTSGKANYIVEQPQPSLVLLNLATDWWQWKF